MKKFINLILILVLISNHSWSQVPEKFNYQAVIRDNSGELVVSQNVGLKISILNETSGGDVLYVEEHTVTTNSFGQVVVFIGDGSLVTGDFSIIDWGQSDKFLKLEVDISGGTSYVTMGTSQMLSVPFALYANNVANKDDADADPFNEIQILTISNDTIYLVDGGYVKLPMDQVNDADNDPSNELQDILLEGDTLRLSDGSEVVFSYDSSRWAINGDKMYYNTGNVGIGSSNPLSKLDVKSNETSGALFQVINANNDTVFAVYPDGVKVFVDSETKGNVGGFTVSGRSPTKDGEMDILRVTPDSTRFYVNDTVTTKGKVGGFAVSGRSPTKGLNTDLLFVTADSTRIYVNESTGTKGKVGGFAVSGRSPTKSTISSFMNLTSENYFIGHQSGISISNGLYNSFFGYQSGMDNFSGNRNIFMGYQSGFSNISGSDNTFVGNQSGMYQQTGNDNIYIGNESGENIINGTRNIYIGKQAGFNANSSLNTVAIGYQSGYSNTADNNTFVGPFSGMSNTTGRENLYMGHTAAQLIESGNWNVILGAWAGHYGPKGNNNVIIGSYAGNVVADSLSGNVIIGSFVGRSNTSSNRLFIDNKNTSYPLIYGEFDNTLLRLNGEVGIGRTPITNDLEVNGTASKTVAGSWIANSDKRIKREIKDINNAGETLMKLHPVMFKYTEEWRTRNPEIKDQFYYNFIAQEYQEIFPESVTGSGEYIEGDSDEILQLDSYNAQIVTVKAVQDLIKDNKEQQSQIKDLKTENEELKIRIAKIEKLLLTK